jgi:hypothetical protein
MPQVTTGATLLRADVRFPEVHELPRSKGSGRAAVPAALFGTGRLWP